MSGDEEEDSGATHSSMADLVTDTEDEDWDEAMADIKSENAHDDGGDNADNNAGNDVDVIVGDNADAGADDEKKQVVHEDNAPAEEQKRQGARVTWDNDIIAPTLGFHPILGVGMGSIVIKSTTNANDNTTDKLVKIMSFTNSTQLRLNVE